MLQNFGRSCLGFFRGENLWTTILILFVIVIFSIPHILISEINISMFVMGGGIAGFFLLSLFLWSQKPYDEREESQRLQICKYKTIGGEYVLMLVIIYQSFMDRIDTTLIIVLICMHGVKLGLQFYNMLGDTTNDK